MPAGPMLQLMLAILAFGLLGAGAVAAALALRLGVTGTVLTAYVVACSVVVLGAELLTPFRAIGVSGYLVWEAIVAAFAVAVWVRCGRPRPAFPRASRGLLRRHPVLVVLTLCVAAGLGFELFLAVAAPPNNWDALAYHLSRAAAWYQNRSLAFFPAHTSRENAFPGNAEIQILFGMVFTHGGRLSALPQFVAQLVLIVGIFGIARRLGFGRPDAAFAGLLFATLSEVALEATTAQNDLVVAAFVTVAAYFVLGRERKELLLAAAAFGLALGTKLTALYALPLLLLLVVFTVPWRRWLELAAAAAVGFALLGSFVFVENVAHGGSPLGPQAELQSFKPAITPTDTISTTARTLYRFVDLSGYENAEAIGRNQGVGKFVFRTLDIDPNPASATQTPFAFGVNTYANEDLSYFGPLGALALLPIAFGYLGAFALRRASAPKVVLALAVPVFAVELALTYSYNAWLGRFMVVPVALAAVLLARLYSLRILSAVCAALGVLFLFFAIAHNERKPVGLDGTTAIWSMPRDRAEALTLPAGSTFQAFDAIVPSHARVGVLFGDDDWDYPLYGPHLTRHLVVLPTHDPFRVAASEHLDWVVVGSVKVASESTWTGLTIGDWRLLAPSGTAAARRLETYGRKPSPFNQV